MNIHIHKAIVERLKQSCDWLNDVRLYNSQADQLERERPLVPPVALLQYSGLALENMARGVQRLKMELTVHLLLATLDYEDEQMIARTTDLAKALHCWAPPKGTPLQRVTVRLDERATNLYVQELVFEGEIMDDLLYNGPVEVDLSPKLKIDC